MAETVEDAVAAPNKRVTKASSKASTQKNGAKNNATATNAKAPIVSRTQGSKIRENPKTDWIPSSVAYSYTRQGDQTLSTTRERAQDARTLLRWANDTNFQRIRG